MKSSVLYDIIEAGEGKRDFIATISRKMKRDMVDFFSFDKARKYHCLEFGFWRGHTTHILSHLFKTVTTIDINDGSKIIPEVLERDNVEFIYPMDVYDRNPDNVWRKLKFEDTYPKFNVFFIDCVHDTPHIQKDINNCLTIADLSKEVYFIIDDYGTTLDNNTIDNWNSSINQYIRDLVIRTSNFEVSIYVGEDVGYEYSRDREPLKDREGVILKWQI
jgi:hypothetical protein